MKLDGRHVLVTGGGGFLGGSASNTLVAFALPDVPRKPLPAAVSKAVAAAAVARRNLPKVGSHPPLVLQAGAARALVAKTCGTGCHSVEVVTSQRMNRDEWSSIVLNMVARGAQASDAEAQAIVDYLATNLRRSQ